MSDLLSASVLRNLADKVYEKRKMAALEVEAVVKALGQAGDHERITSLVHLLIHDYALSPQTNHRKGGLIGLAAATVGLAGEAAQHLHNIVPPVLRSFSDQDSRVRYYACEALYNIAKVTRGDFIVFFNDVFDALCKLSADSDLHVQQAAHLLDRLVKDIVTESDQFSIEEFIPLLRDRMHVLSPQVRQFLVGWITVLDSVPDIDMLGFLPDFLDGLFNMLGESGHEREIRVQADNALREFLEEVKNAPSVEYGRMAEILVQRAGSSEEFTRLTALTWIHEFVKLGGSQLFPYYAAILGALLPCISDEEDKIRQVARETNEEQMARVGPTSGTEGLDVAAVLTVVRREMSSEWEATRLEALRWILLMLNTFRAEVVGFLDDSVLRLFPALLHCLADESDGVVLSVLEVLAKVAQEKTHFHRLLQLMMERFNADRTLLEKRGSLVIRQLCVLMDPELIYCQLSTILEQESDYEFAALMVQALNLILLTAPELLTLRGVVKQSLEKGGRGDLFWSLYPTWCHSPVATISLCLLAQAYAHSSEVVSSLGEGDITVNLLVQVDRLVHLLETPIFAYLRLQLLDPTHFPHLLKTLYGLLMLLPQQTTAFRILRTRLRSIPSAAQLSVPIQHRGPEGGEVEDAPRGSQEAEARLGLKMKQFGAVQQWHRERRKEAGAGRHGGVGGRGRGGGGGAVSNVSSGAVGTRRG